MTFSSRRRLEVMIALSAITAMVLAVLPPSSAAAAALPVVKATPSKGLVDLQNVTVSGTGFSPDVQVGTVECGPSALSESGCSLGTLVYARTDANGAFTLKRYVRRLIVVGSSKVDCASAKGCIIGAGNVSNVKEANGTRVFFNPKVPPKVSTITVSPNAKLLDHQLVTVSGKGFAPGSSASLSECLTPKSGVASQCGYANQRYVTVGNDGTFTATNFPLERRETRFTKGKQEIVDCARIDKLCEIQATAPTGAGSIPAKAGLRFDPKAKAAIAVVQLSNSTQLHDMDAVTVNGFGFLPGSSVYIQQCGGPVSAQSCDASSYRALTANLHGGFTVTFYVRRLISVFGAGGNTSLDCATRACRLLLQGSPEQPVVRSPLHFDPASPPVARTIVASPNTGLSDNQHIAVTIGGFTPAQPTQLIECTSDAIAENNFGYCDYNTSETVTPTGVTPLQTAFDVRATITGQSGPVDCTAAAGACVLVAIGGGVYGSPGTPAVNAAATDLTFGP